MRTSRWSARPAAAGSSLVLSLGLVACAHGFGSPPAPPASSAVTAPATAKPDGLRFAPHDRDRPAREGSTVALTRFGGRTVALVADEDDAVVHSVDIDTGDELSTTRLAGTPSQLVVSDAGNVYVALRDQDVVEVLEATGKRDASLVHASQLATAREPVGVALTPDGSGLVVASGWGHALTLHDAATGARTARFDLARDPRSVVVSDDGTKAFVSHVVGARVSVVDLTKTAAPGEAVREISLNEADIDGEKAKAAAKREGRGAQPFAMNAMAPSSPPRGATLRVGCQGFALAKSVAPAGRILAPQVLVDPGDSVERSTGYGSGGGLPAEVPDIAVIDEGAAMPLAASLQVRPPRDGGAERPACVLPRAAAVSSKTHSLFVTCLGIDAVVEYDAASIDPRASERRRFAVASGPTGIALDADGEHPRAAVWSQFARTLNIVDLDSPAPVAPTAPRGARRGSRGVLPLSAETRSRVTRIALTRRAARPARFDLALGRALFHAVGDPRIAADGRACASCHPDGRDDSLTWATPDGPRQTPMLAGRLEDTAPYGWNGAGASVHAHLKQTFQRLQGGGLSRSETDALIAYVASMPQPALADAAGASRAPVEPQAEVALVARGKAIFEDPVAECASCHEGHATADGTPHVVASKTASDAAAAFDTPSLHFVGGTAPYFHDGRYATLRELLIASDGKMGHTAQLSSGEVDALEAYVRSL